MKVLPSWPKLGTLTLDLQWNMYLQIISGLRSTYIASTAVLTSKYLHPLATI
jgi:hypothetical protein